MLPLDGFYAEKRAPRRIEVYGPKTNDKTQIYVCSCSCLQWCMFVCVRVHVYTHGKKAINAHTHTYTYIYICTCICIHVCTCNCPPCIPIPVKLLLEESLGRKSSTLPRLQFMIRKLLAPWRHTLVEGLGG